MIGERSNDAYRRLRNAERDLEETKEDRVRLLTQLTNLEHAHKKLAETKQKVVAQHEADSAAKTEKYEAQIKDLGLKLENVTEAHARTCRDIQQLLVDQKRMAEKWKQETTHQALQHEHLIEDLRTQLHRCTTRIEELESQLLAIESRRNDLVARLQEEKQQHTRVGTRCQAAEARVEALLRQVSGLAAKEVELVEDRKRMQKELDRAHLEKDRLERENLHKIRSLRMSSPTRFRSSTRSEGPLEDDDLSVLEDVTNREVKELRADIDRVKQRSLNRRHHMDDIVLAAGLDDDAEDELSD
ncbi:uncharacterized protein EV422DRAFT_204359 [Fimicolochytrium jonesii]|uniref:uncharacterized protein n=1 Tax=Fimicolochytrium jonesii TaxID=1396493 RepID=UPI0022FE9C3D|nr:uncharacterized protein EV422DRAFT_204359 [Fimicolochytrium jonesii]KAI8818064.1 hypothetical protein EV422DRAFT_204359 [Fimicolochytrium jonesii]